MNVIDVLYKNNVSRNKDFNKIINLITVSQHAGTGYYHFDNVHKIQTDLGYSNYLGISEESYCLIIYSNKVSYRHAITKMFVHRKDAEEQRWLLCALILNKYGTYEKAIEGMLKVKLNKGD